VSLSIVIDEKPEGALSLAHCQHAGGSNTCDVINTRNVRSRYFATQEIPSISRHFSFSGDQHGNSSVMYY
jgi:hypothetical protein